MEGFEEDSKPDIGTLPGLLTSDYLLSTTFPEPVWVIPGLLPAGLSFLAGAPKVGKSWLALQIAKVKASGGTIMNKQVEPGSVLYLALEDNPIRLQKRMIRQSWPPNLKVHFMDLRSYLAIFADLRGGSSVLGTYMEAEKYSLVVIDTLSRACSGDQNDVAEMTQALSPIQALAHNYNCAILVIDHHHKISGDTPDAIADILGSTAKGGVADTILGLYRKRGQEFATLNITGRDVEETQLRLKLDKQTGCWLIGDEGDALSFQEKELLAALEQLGGEGRNVDIANAVNRKAGPVHKQLVELSEKGKVSLSEDDEKIWSLVQ